MHFSKNCVKLFFLVVEIGHELLNNRFQSHFGHHLSVPRCLMTPCSICIRRKTMSSRAGIGGPLQWVFFKKCIVSEGHVLYIRSRKWLWFLQKGPCGTVSESIYLYLEQANWRSYFNYIMKNLVPRSWTPRWATCCASWITLPSSKSRKSPKAL